MSQLTADGITTQQFFRTSNPSDAPTTIGRLFLAEEGSGLVNPSPQPQPVPDGCSSNPVNTICGKGAGISITSANKTTLFGLNAGASMTVSGNNTFIGNDSGRLVLGGVDNVFVGKDTGAGVKSGSRNVLLGSEAGSNYIGVESRNIMISNSGVANDSAVIRIGTSGTHETKTFIQGIHTVVPTAGSLEMCTIDSDGHMGSQTIPSSSSSDPDNTLEGLNAGQSITSGVDNTLIGVRAGQAQDTANDVTALGDEAGLVANISGNIYIGSGAGNGVTSGSQMTIVGTDACQSMTGGIGSITAIGSTALQSATNAPSNVAIGNQVMSSLLTGSGNTIVGALGMRNATACAANVGVGFDVLHDNLTSPSNTALGWESGFSITGGTGFNTLIGKSCCQNLLTGASNIVLGNDAASNYVGAESNNLVIGASGTAAESGTIRIGVNGTHSSTFIQGIATVTPAGTVQHVIIDTSTGELGSTALGGLDGFTDVENTVLGVDAGDNISSGESNTILGYSAANFLTSAGESVIIGAHAAENALNTGRGIFIGANCGLDADMTSGTVAIGFNALQNLSGSTGNTTALGFESLQACTSGGGNTALGALTLKNLTTSVVNTAVGRFALTNIKDGCDSNTACGSGALLNLGLGVLGTGVGSSNTAVGMNCMGLFGGEVAGNDFNTGIGRSAGHAFLFGSSNLYLGHLSGSAHGAVSPGENNNICLMSEGVSGEQNTIHLGKFSTHTSCFVAGISGTPSGTPVACIQDPTTGEIGAGQVQMSGSGDMSMINSMSIDGDGQILLETSLNGAQAIQVVGTGTASGLDVDMTGLINFTSSLANTQAISFIASDSAGGLLFQAGLGGSEMTSTGAYDWHTSIDQAGEGIKFRATGTQGEIQLDAGSGGVRIMDTTGLFINDSTSNFQQQLIVPTIAADIQWTFPSAQGANNTRLENNGSGVLSWVAPSAGTTPDSTGVLSGGLLTVNGGDGTKFDIEDGTGLIYNPSTQVKTEVTWSGLTAQDNGGWTGILTYISISSVGGVIYNTSKVTNAETRSQIFLGVLVHVDGVNINVTNDEQCVLVNFVNSIRDLSEALGFINISGNTMSSAASALTILKSSGEMFKFGANWLSAEDDPHVVSLAAIDTSGVGEFQYRMQDGTSSALTLTDIIPNILDDNTNYPGTTYANNRFGVSRIYVFTSNALKIQPPQFDYGNLDDALNAITTEAFVTEQSILENGMLIGFLITQGNTSDLTDAADALFIGAGKLGGIATTGGTGSVGTMGVIRDYQVSDFLNSTASDWQISVLAATVPDDLFNALNVREYLVGADSGVGMKLFIPVGVEGLSVTISWRKDLANSGTVIWQFFAYNIPNGASITTGTWDVSETISTDDPGSDVETVTTTVNFPLGDLGLTAGESCLLQIVRDVSDTFATSALLMGCSISEGTP